jgi:alkylation response protein AidB-like acyl-CoA dehydrogenase
MTIGTVVTAVTDVVDGKKRISAIFVPKDTPGFTISPNLNKLGWNHADTRNLYLEDVRVPKENLVGERGNGLKQFLTVLNIGRITVGITALGLAQQCLNESLKYAKERTQFGKPLSAFQLIQAKLAEMATEIEAARQLMYYTAWLVQNGKRFIKEASMFKYFVSEVARRAANQAVQIHGGYGYMMEYPVARAFRDYKVMEIGEGTTEIQKLVIARELGC